jgi:hypothetical protein
MINTAIKFPASYTNTLTPYETEYLAVSLGVKFDSYDRSYDNAFDQIMGIVSHITRANIGNIKIIEEMNWEQTKKVATFVDNQDRLIRKLYLLDEDHAAEHLCKIALSDDGMLPLAIAKKVGKIIRDLINENIHDAKT